MASFADKQPINFNPYIQQLPVEQMSMVGMELQRRYDEGVQRIQASIDRVAGLDIARDVDKNYLQTKLNSLTDKLAILSGADFSKYQLTNSVAGMASNVAKDENVMNAVSSTARYRKEAKRMEDAIEKGTSNPANEYHFQRKVNRWLQSTKPGERFNDSYSDFFDVDKHVKETFNALKPDGYSIDEIYQKDSQGNYIKEKIQDPVTGEVKEQYVLSTTMTRLKKEGMFPKKVQETLDHIFSDPRVDKQLQISGEYQMSGYTPEILASKLSNTERDDLKRYNDRIGELNIKLNTTTDPKEKEKIKEEIKQHESSKENISSYYNGLRETISKNPDYVRGLLYREKAKSEYTGMYTSIKEETSVLESPTWRANFDMQKEANDVKYKWASLKQADDHFRSTYSQKERELGLREKALEIQALKAGRGIGKPGTPSGAGGPSSLQGPEEGNRDWVGEFESAYEQAAADFGDASTELLYASGIMSEENLEYYMKRFNLSRESAMEALINAQAKQEGVSPIEYKTKWYAKAIQQLNAKPHANDPVTRAVKESAENAQRTFETFSNRKKQIEKEAPISVNLETLTPFYDGDVLLTPEIQYKLAVVYAGSAVGANENLKKRAEAERKSLEKRGIDSKIVSQLYNKKKSAEQLRQESFGLIDYSGIKKEQVGLLELTEKLLTDNTIVDQLENRKNLIKNTTMFYPTRVENVFGGSVEDNREIKEQLKGLVGTYTKAEKNASPDFVSRSGKIMEMLGDGEGAPKGSVVITTTKNRVTQEVTPVVTFRNEKNELLGEMTITPEEANAIGKDVSSWYSDPQTLDVEERVLVIGNSTTSRGDVREPSTYQNNDVALMKRDFTYLSNIKDDVKANFKEQNITEPDGTKSKVCFMHLYVNPADGGEPFVHTYSEPARDIATAIQAVKNISPQMIELLKAQYKN